MTSHCPLIYDVSNSGHRVRDAGVVATLLGGTVLLQSPASAFGQLLRNRGCVIWQTADYAPGWFTLLCLLRSLAGRKTIGICYRNNNAADGKYLRHFIRRFLFHFWNLVPFCTALTTCAPVQAHKSPKFLFDTEWWDLLASPLAEASVPDVRGGKKSILFLGSVSYLKGVPFFIKAAQMAQERGLDWNFVLIGSTHDLSAQEQQELAAANITVYPGPKDDAAFVSFMRQADLLWCCYHPVYDQSSGIFGRSIQLDKPTIVRRGSYLELWQKEYGRGIAVNYDDTEELLAALDQPMPRQKNADSRSWIAALAMERLLQACS